MANKVLFIILLFFSLAFCGFNCSGDNSQNRQNQGNDTHESTQKNQVNTEKEQSVEVITKYKHDKSSYTQGLYFLDGFLYESDGLKGNSKLRKLDVETGKVIREYKLDDVYFAEGITITNDKIYQLTWTNGKCFVYDLKTFKLLNTYNYYGEGWGITHNETHLICSDGSSYLKFYKKDDFSLDKSINVTDQNMNPVYYLNELEMIKGELWANIYQTDKIVRIDPNSGRVLGWIDLSPLRNYLSRNDAVDVLNGIAYDAEKDIIYMTGKFWPWLFKIRLTD